MGKLGHPDDKAFQTTISLIGLKRITLDLTEAYVYGIKVKSEKDESDLYMGSYDNSIEHIDLEENEVIIGVYGDSNDNYFNVLKRFGFIIGTLS